MFPTVGVLLVVPKYHKVNIDRAVFDGSDVFNITQELGERLLSVRIRCEQIFHAVRGDRHDVGRCVLPITVRGKQVRRSTIASRGASKGLPCSNVRSWI